MLMIPRPALEDTIVEAIETHKLVVLTGARGAGKTALLQKLERRWPGPAALVQLEPIACSPEVLRTETLRLAEETLSRAPASGDVPASLAKRTRGSLLLLDDITELRTLSYYPDVEKPLESWIKVLSDAREPTVATTRFSYWMHSLFPDQHFLAIPPLTPGEVSAAGGRNAELVVRATGGLAVHAARLAGGDVEETLVEELAIGGAIDAECRATMSELLHRARGYGACKTVLRVLAEEEGLKLTEVARRMDRTPGSTRDYLRWLEEVDLIVSREKRFYFVDPILRLWLRIHGQGVPASDAGVRREVEAHLGAGIEVSRDFQFPPRPSEDLVEID